LPSAGGPAGGAAATRRGALSARRPVAAAALLLLPLAAPLPPALPLPLPSTAAARGGASGGSSGAVASHVTEGQAACARGASLGPQHASTAATDAARWMRRSLAPGYPLFHAPPRRCRRRAAPGRWARGCTARVRRRRCGAGAGARAHMLRPMSWDRPGWNVQKVRR
jgi:hypothetical protein